jgi:hypothetical protein
VLGDETRNDQDDRLANSKLARSAFWHGMLVSFGDKSKQSDDEGKSWDAAGVTRERRAGDW